MKLLLLRHGETTTNTTRQLSTTVPGPELNDVGRAQAASVAVSLADSSADALYVSTLRRTAQTAEPLAAALGLTPITLDGLREIDAGDLDGHSDLEARTTYEQTIGAWVTGRLDVAMPGAIDGHAFLERFDEAVRRMARPGSTAIAVTSNAAMRAWAGFRASNLDLSFVATHTIDNAETIELDGDVEAGWRCARWADEILPG